ncbi:MAG: hypothetical protein GY699_26450 [Desulfobacteraceae bacterium]|nr:hypothetical protein [Desulfobacteraceae bacterium]
MSISTTIYCVDCILEAPEIGDQGFIGMPSLDEKIVPKHKDYDVLQNFGSIYRALSDINLVTYELESFHRFLKEHEGHSIHQSFEGNDDPWPDKLNDYYSEHLEIPEYKISDEGFVNGRFELSAGENTLVTSDEELFLSLEKKILSKADIKNFKKRISKVYEWAGNFFCTFGALDPYGDLGKIVTFIDEFGKIKGGITVQITK